MLPCSYRKNSTVLNWRCYPQDSLLLRLTPEQGAASDTETEQTAAGGSYGIRMAEELALNVEKPTEALLPPPDRVELHEPNVCLLDKARWRVDDGVWHDAEEMLRLGIAAKRLLGMSTSTAAGAQPWILPPEKPEHTLSLETEFCSEVELPWVELALEDTEQAQVLLNGRHVSMEDCGAYVDEAIRTLRIGPVIKGQNILQVTRPFGTASSTENMFLLGDFGVSVRGTRMWLTESPETLYYGDWTGQGLPFYGGPLTCHFHIQAPVSGKALTLRLGLLAAPCAVVLLDGQRVANVSLAPHEAKVGVLTPGVHELAITLYPSRINTFGTFHLNKRDVIWFGPNAWRTTGMDWTYTYRLTPLGLLSEPHLYEG